MHPHPFQPMPQQPRLCDTCGQPRHYAPGGASVHTDVRPAPVGERSER